MKAPATVEALNEFGRVRLSRSFMMREFLHSETANLHGIANVPDDPDLAIAAGRALCETLLEPLNASFGRVIVRSGYRAPELNRFANEMQRAGRKGYNCASNEANFARHIWDRRDGEGCMGAMVCLVIPSFADRYQQGADWRGLAFWIHDHLPYSEVEFYPKFAAFNIAWHERPKRRITSNINPKGLLTKPGMDNHDGSHNEWYKDLPALVRTDTAP